MVLLLRHPERCHQRALAYTAQKNAQVSAHQRQTLSKIRRQAPASIAVPRPSGQRQVTTACTLLLPAFAHCVPYSQRLSARTCHIQWGVTNSGVSTAPGTPRECSRPGQHRQHHQCSAGQHALQPTPCSPRSRAPLCVPPPDCVRVQVAPAGAPRRPAPRRPAPRCDHQPPRKRQPPRQQQPPRQPPAPRQRPPRPAFKRARLAAPQQPHHRGPYQQAAQRRRAQ